MAGKQKGLRQLRISVGSAPHRAAMNSEGVWIKPVNGKKGANNPWRFLAWEDLASAAATVSLEPVGDEE